MTWAQMEDYCQRLMLLYADEWKCPLPERSRLPSASVEAECDAWCIMLVAQQADPLPAPRHVQPWILARLAMCGVYAKTAAHFGKQNPPALTPELLTNLLVTEWHASLRQMWLDDRQSFSM